MHRAAWLLWIVLALLVPALLTPPSSSAADGTSTVTSSNAEYVYDAPGAATTSPINTRTVVLVTKPLGADRSTASAFPISRGRATKGEGFLARRGLSLSDETGAFTPGAYLGRGGSRLTNAQVTDLADYLGFRSTGQRLRGQTIFRDGNRYIVQDIDAHSGGVFKMADSVRGLGSKSTRTGTYDEQLNRIGP